MADLHPPVQDRDHVLGPAAAPIVLTQYGDFECPLSHEVYVLISRLRGAMEEDVQYVYRHFPLNKIHPFAERAAVASEAAAAQGRFWEMHALLFDHRKELSEDNLRRYAAELGLDVDRFARDLDAPEPAARLREDMRSGVRSGVDTTLNLFINGERYEGEMKVQQIALSIDRNLSPG